MSLLIPFALQKIPERSEVEIQVRVGEPELLLQLVHALGELHERLPEPLHLLVVERPLLHAAERLALHQLPQQLDQGEHELGEPALDELVRDYLGTTPPSPVERQPQDDVVTPVPLPPSEVPPQ